MHTEEDYISVGSIRLHVVTAGPAHGEPIVFLHGFPEFWWSWRDQMEAAAAAGYRAIAPDLRGYNLSDKPTGVNSYLSTHLRADVKGLLDALGHDCAHIVGHDWGGAVAWLFAAFHPERTRTLTVMNCPHPTLFLKLLTRSRTQLRKSWYMAFFQLPFLPERTITRPGAMTRVFLSGAKNRVPFSPDVVAHYEQAIQRPGAATGAINYYRALARAWPPRVPRITRPTHVIWGKDDPILGMECNDRLSDVADQVRVHYINDAGHWVQQEQPAVVNDHFLQFLGSNNA